MSNPALQPLLDFYERCRTEHGATCQGVGWPREAEAIRRLQVMAELWQEDTAEYISVLDLGCGYGALLDMINAGAFAKKPDYWGIDILPDTVALARSRHPQARFEQRDIIASPLPEQCVDYIVINGVLTNKTGLSQEQMRTFATTLLAAAFRACRKGLAFNVMSPHVDWTREDLFHWPFDEAAAFMRAACSRHYRFRSDYGLYEYTAYVYREPNL